MTAADSHITWKEALDFAEGRAGLRSHSKNCSKCAETLAAASDLVGTLRLASSHPSSDLGWADRAWSELSEAVQSSPPSDLAPDVAWAEAEAVRLSDSSIDPATPTISERIGNKVQALGERLLDEVAQVARTVQATLLADSWTDAAVAVRGSSASAPRTLLYETDNHTVSLSFQPGLDPQRIDLAVIGQLTPHEGTELTANAIISVRGREGSEVVTSIDAFGTFRFDKLDQAPHNFQLIVGRDRIEIGPLPELEI